MTDVHAPQRIATQRNVRGLESGDDLLGNKSGVQQEVDQLGREDNHPSVLHVRAEGLEHLAAVEERRQFGLHDHNHERRIHKHGVR